MLAIFKSRKSVLALIGLVVYVFSMFAPEVAVKAEQYGGFAYVLLAVAIFGITLEDSVKAWAARPRSADELLREVEWTEEEIPAGGTE